MALITKPTALSKIWATTGVKETPADSKITQGWVVELPPYQFDNWLNNRQDTFIAHVNQLGIPVWDAETEYQGGKSYVQGSDGVVYKALLTNTNVVPSNPLNSATWVKAFEDFGSVAALTVTVNTLSTNYSTLAGIANTAAARTNLSVFSKTESDARFAPVAGNASQTFSVANATADSHAINRGQFNALLTQATETQAGISEIATQSEMNVGTLDTVVVTPKKGKDTYLMRSNNLSDLANLATAKITLGIKDVGTTAGTVAAGDDSRITSAVPNTRNVVAGNGLTGGGALLNNLTLDLGTPTTVNASSANIATADSHTHALDITSFFSDRQLGVPGYYVLPGNYIDQWGRHHMNGGSSVQEVVYPRPMMVTNIQLTNMENASFESGGSLRVLTYSNTGFTFDISGTNTFTSVLWRANGILI